MDGFSDTFFQLTSDNWWHVEDRIIVSRSQNNTSMEFKLLELRENKSRVIILHCSEILARRVFRLAKQNGFTGKGYAWFVTKDVVTRNSRSLDVYPEGLLGITIDPFGDYKQIIQDTMLLLTKGINRFHEDHKGALADFVNNRYQGCTSIPTAEQRSTGDRLYRYLKNTSVNGRTGNLTFDADGYNINGKFTFYNLIKKDRSKKWRRIGYFRNNTYQMRTIVWPGGTVAGPISKGTMKLRVVTNAVPPFIMEQESFDGKCLSAVACLKVHTKHKETLDDIFRDYENVRDGITNSTNESLNYELRCCTGLSVTLLQALARDLDFKFQLYLVSDGKYGAFVNGSWNGMVEDLLHGAAHMAVAAFSITNSRSRVIDFTHPYFFSGFSILVSERQRETPIDAFMEPFDQWVWTSIGITALTAAIGIALLEWNSPFGLNPWGRKRKTNYTLGSSLNMVFAILFQHTIKTKSPKAWPSKWLQNFWAGASIFIYSSYTANLAAFLAGKNSGVTITGIHDPKLIEQGRLVGVIRGTALEDFVMKVNPQLLSKAQRFPSLKLSTAVRRLMLPVDRNGSLDAYLDDTPILEYARSTMDVKCHLKLVGQGFGEDGYGIGLPKHSWLKVPLTKKILQYHQNGYIDDLKDLYFSRGKCNYNSNSNQLQGEANSMNFSQHAGLYLLLGGGIFICILLLFLEHAVFKWMVPYWRRKPTKSFWKSKSMMFWSQRLYRIITSEVLVSPHHSAREMMEVVKNRDFTKLFQKSVRKQEQKARNRKNLFSVVEQLQWKQRRAERLSKNTSGETDCSHDSDNSATPVNLHREPRLVTTDEEPINTDTNEETGDDWPENWEKEWIADDEEAGCIAGRHDSAPLYKDGHVNHSFANPADVVKYNVASESVDFKPETTSASEGIPCSKFDIFDEDNDSAMADLEDNPMTSNSSNPATFPLLPQASGSGFPPLSNSSSSDGNISNGPIPNGVLILSPNGDVFACENKSGRNPLVRQKLGGMGNLRHYASHLPQSMKSLPQSDKQCSPNPLTRSRTLERLNDRSVSNDSDFNDSRVNLEELTKEELFLMWKLSERDLNNKLRQALRDKADLEKKLQQRQRDTNV